MIGKIRKFFMEAASELKKVSWSTKQELMEATWIVIISSCVLGLFIGITDFVLSKLVGLLIQ